jgi:hypothetical protein
LVMKHLFWLDGRNYHGCVDDNSHNFRPLLMRCIWLARANVGGERRAKC